MRPFDVTKPVRMGTTSPAPCQGMGAKSKLVECIGANHTVLQGILTALLRASADHSRPASPEHVSVDNAAAAGDAAPSMQALVQRAVVYCYYEFALEESLMQSSAYPKNRRTAHLAAHRSILNKLLEIEAELDVMGGQASPAVGSGRTLDDLVRVLLHTVQLHVAWADEDLSQHLIARYGEVGYKAGNLHAAHIERTGSGDQVVYVVKIEEVKVESATTTTTAAAPALKTSGRGWKPRWKAKAEDTSTTVPSPPANS